MAVMLLRSLSEDLANKLASGKQLDRFAKLSRGAWNLGGIVGVSVKNVGRF